MQSDDMQFINQDNLSRISTKFRSATTSLGIPFDVAKSALQKYIRRGYVTKAQYVAVDLDMFKYVHSGQSTPSVPSGEGKRYITNFYNRLRVILLEDIGIACPELLLRADKYLNTYLSETSPSTTLLTLVREMCMCPHSRFYSHIRAYTRFNTPPPVSKNKKQFPLPKDPDLQEHTNNLISSLEQKNIYAWYWAQQILLKEKTNQKFFNSTRPGFLIFSILQQFLFTSLEKDTLIICIQWYKTLKNKEQFLCVIHPIYLYILSDRICTNFSFPYNNLQSPNGHTLSPYKNYSKLILDNYVYDMHTYEGRLQNKSSSDFAVEGSLVCYEKVFERDLSLFYIKSKIKDISLESKTFSLKCRAQLICSNVRPDTYFAKENTRNVVVKGPYLSLDKATSSFSIQSILRLFPHVNYIKTNIKLLIPDMFDGLNNPKTPLGCRTQISPNTPYYFVVMEDLLNLEELPITTKSSKMWEPTQVADYDKIFSMIDAGFAVPSEMSEKAKLSLLVQIIVRYIFKIGDFASRNFLRIKDKVYNLDTEGVGINNKLTFSKKETEILLIYLEKNKEDVLSILKEWLELHTIWDIVESTFNIKNDVVAELEKVISSPEKIFEK